MTDRGKSPSSPSKFLFDVHVFDEDGRDLNARPDVPPPPMFTESEREIARAEGFAAGKKEGLAESAASREQFIARSLETISAHFSTLFAAEHFREKIYEQEASHLSLLILQKIFPVLNERIGRDELQRALHDILASASTGGQIDIEVSEDCAAEIDAALRRKWPAGEKGPAFSVKGRPDIKDGACRLSWADGGAVRDPESIVAAMKARILAWLPPESVRGNENNAITGTDNAPESGETP